MLVAKTDPPLLCVAAKHAAKRRGLHLVNWLQDLYPEVAVQLGVPLIKGPLGRGLLRLRDASLRAADANVVVGERMAEVIRERGIAPGTIDVIPNWCDDEEIQPLEPLDNPLRREWGSETASSSDIPEISAGDTSLQRSLLRQNAYVVTSASAFLFIGGGKKFAELARSVRERGLDHRFRFLPYQERKVLRLSLGVSDIHLISLRPELEGLKVPSKLYGIAGMVAELLSSLARESFLLRIRAS